MATHFLARISESRFCPNNIFYYHTILGMEFGVLNEKCLVRRPLDIKFEAVDQSKMDKKRLDVLLDELVLVTGKDGVDNQREIFANFFCAGNTCFLARKNGALIGYYWAFKDRHVITYDDYKKKNIEIDLAPSMIFFGNGFIHPEYRLKGIFPFFAKFCIDQFPVGSRLVTATDIENNQSFNSHRRLGYVEQFKLTCITFMNLQLHLIKNTRTRLRIRFHLYKKNKAMPKITSNMLLPGQV